MFSTFTGESNRCYEYNSDNYHWNYYGFDYTSYTNCYTEKHSSTVGCSTLKVADWDTYNRQTTVFNRWYKYGCESNNFDHSNIDHFSNWSAMAVLWNLYRTDGKYGLFSQMVNRLIRHEVYCCYKTVWRSSVHKCCSSHSNSIVDQVDTYRTIEVWISQTKR